MVLRIICCILLPAIAYSSTIEKKYSFSRPDVRDGFVYVDGCRTSVVHFEPGLPSKPITLLLPHGEDAVSFKVDCSQPIELDGTYYVNPCRPGGIMSNPPPADYYTRTSSVYAIDEFYPAEIKSPQFFTQYRYGHSLFIASLRPVQYNPVTGKIRYYTSITVKIKTEKIRSPLPVYRFNSFIKSQLSVEVDNQESLESLRYVLREADDYDYLIITTDALKNSWNDFLDFNKRRCLKTQLKTIEEINSTVTGTDSPDKLKKYIKQEYEANGIVFVMLGGDDNFNLNNTPMTSAITHRSYSAEFKDYGVNAYSDRDVAADMFYETLDGQELEDLGWEVYVGRFAADNAAELKNMIDKTIKYSEQPAAAAVKKAVVAGEKKWANINGGTCWGKDQMILLYGTVDKNGYTTTCFPTTTMTMTELFEKDAVWSKTEMINAINADQNWIFHTGHSNNFSIMKFQMGSGGALGDVASLKNEAYYIGYTTGCYCGAWDNRKIADQGTINTGHYDAATGDCIVEAFTCGTSYGSVAFVSNTRYGLGDDGHASQDGTDGSTIRFMRFFLNGLYKLKMHNIAIMNAYSKWINKQEILVTDVSTKPYYGQMAYCAYELNILGDPALSIWTETPTTLNPSIGNSIAPDKFVWESGLPYTWVAIGKPDGEILTANFTGENGLCTIDDAAYKSYCAANAGGKVTLRIKAHNYLPFEREVTIGSTGISFGEAVSLYEVSNHFIPNRKEITFKFNLPEYGKVEGFLYNTRGIIVATIAQGYLHAGMQSILVRLDGLAGGLYLYNIIIGEKRYSGSLAIAE